MKPVYPYHFSLSHAAKVFTPEGGMVALLGNRSMYWPPGSYVHTFHGLIDNLPDNVKQYLIAEGHIEWRDEA